LSEIDITNKSKYLGIAAAVAGLATALAAVGAFGENGVSVDPLAPEASAFLDVDAAEYSKQGDVAYREGRYADAAGLYLAYLRSNVYDGRTIYNLACCYGLLGEAELAATNLKRAYDAGFRDVAIAADDPDFDPVRDVEPFASTFAGLIAETEVSGDARTLYLQAPALTPCYVVLPDAYDPEKEYTLVLALHGVGGTAARFATLRNDFADADFIWAVPEAPYPLALQDGIGYSWTAQMSGVEDIRKESYATSSRYVVELVDALRGRYNVGDVYLLGFSQGSYLGYGAALRNPAVFKGLICFGGPFKPAALGAEELTAGRDVRIFIAHGEDDPAVSYEESTTARDDLEAFGYDVTFRSFSGGHEVPAEVLREAEAWMKE
jgi:predicted esterase